MWSQYSSPLDVKQHFVIRPNASLSQRDSRLLFAGIAVLAMLICIRFMIINAWIVIPFTLIDVIFVGLTLRYVVKKNDDVESISCSQETLSYKKVSGKTSRQWDFQTFWVRVVHSHSNHPWYPSRLFLCSHGRSIEFGSCLTDDERMELAKALQDCVRQFSNRT
ncbi:MAG: DUF2244 domain-containing protein [Gammaproteobacteria bacterium]